jgi:hypothetical protein
MIMNQNKLKTVSSVRHNGWAKVEVIVAHATRDIAKVTEYKVLALSCPGVSWKPYHGKSKRKAYEVGRTVEKALINAGLMVEFKETHVDSIGYELTNKK